ncbi:hypothetical protein M9434_003849 [Picochlorum sp. BPE23]|nr:hypothetical protein M9434_003849 [Picochlorum sp. BPE23]
MEHKDIVLGRLTVKDSPSVGHLRSVLRFEGGHTEDTGASLIHNSFLNTIYFIISATEDIKNDIKQKRIDCPCLWADVDDVKAHVAELHVAYDLGGGVTMRPVSIKPITVEPEYVTREDGAVVLKGCSGVVSKRSYVTLYRLVHILFPTMEAWQYSLDGSSQVTRSKSKAEEDGLIYMDSEDDGMGIRFTDVSGDGASTSGRDVRVVPNLLLGCLEAVRMDREESPTMCLRTIRQFDDVLAIVHGVPGAVHSDCTPLPSPQRQTAFQSPVKKSVSHTRGMDVESAISLIHSCSVSGFKDGTSYLNTVCKDVHMAECAVQNGVLTALVQASKSLMSSTMMGTVEQLSVLTLTTSLILDSCLSSIDACRTLVNDFAESLCETCANPALMIQFLTAMLHRPDVKEAAIDLKLYNAVSTMYMNRLPLLEPLARALLSEHGRRGMEVAEAKQAQSSPASVSTPTPVSSRNSVPMLSLDSLQGEDDENLCMSPDSGLTRATRREHRSSNQVVVDASAPDRSLFGQPSAMQELDHLAQALGESLVAQDLPSVIGYRRHIALNDECVSEYNEYRSEERSLGNHTSSNLDLRAHKIFSADNSEDDSDSVQYSDSEQLSRLSAESAKASDNADLSYQEQVALESVEDSLDVCPLLIEAMLAMHNSFPGGFALDPNPSGIISADLLSFPVHMYDGAAYTRNYLKLLANIATSQENPEHVFLIAIGSKLRSCIYSNGFGSDLNNASMMYYLEMTSEYLGFSSDEGAASVFADTCLSSVMRILNTLCMRERQVDDWDGVVLLILNSVLKILAKVFQISDSRVTGRKFISALFDRKEVMSLLRDVSTQTLLKDEANDSSLSSLEIAEIEKNILTVFASLASLLSRQETLEETQGVAMPNSQILCKVYKRREAKLLTRSYCLQFFSFLITPGTTLIRISLEGEIPSRETEQLQGLSANFKLSSRSVRLRNGIFALLQSLFSANQNPFISDKEITDYYVRLHFIRFLKLYHNPTKDHQAIFLCRQHLSMLCTLAQASMRSGNGHIRNRFQQLSVVGFFVKEMGLEFEALEHGSRFSQIRSESSVSSTGLGQSISQNSVGGLPSDRGEDEQDQVESTSTHKYLSIPQLSFAESGGESNPQSSERNLHLQGNQQVPDVTKKMSPSASGASTSDLRIPAANLDGNQNSLSPFGSKVLERQGTSAALSLDVPIDLSGVFDGSDTPSNHNTDSEKILPIGFTFTGDLDEDVDRLEALGLGESSDDSASFVTSDSETDEDTSGCTGGDGLSAPPQTSKTIIPLLNISSSMRSSLHERNKSAELYNAEQDSEFGKTLRPTNGARETPGHAKMQAVRFSITDTKSSEEEMPGTFVASIWNFDKESNSRLLYHDDELHILAIKLVFMLIMDDNGHLQTTYCDRYPWDKKMQNIPFILQHHLNVSPTLELLPRICSNLHESIGEHAIIFLRLLCADPFRPHWYTSRVRISGAAGAYATVYRCSLPWWSEGRGTVLKVIDAPKHNHDRCSQVEFYSEVSIHQRLLNHPRACQMLDFGVDMGADALVLVLKEYKCSLKQWRLSQEESPQFKIEIYWAIFREIVLACIEILDEGIVHFDLKCDNVLLDPCDGASEDAFQRGTLSSGGRLRSLLKKSDCKGRLAFRVVLGDFGESVMFPGGRDGAQKGSTTQSRGTDAFKSPEMLMVDCAPQTHQKGYDRRRAQGAGAPSDVWSLGCLLFELFTGNVLYNDTDWLQLAARVTRPDSQLIPDDRLKMIADLPGVEDMLRFMLVRDPKMRPTLPDVLNRLEMVQSDPAGDMSSCDSTPRHPAVSLGTKSCVPPRDDVGPISDRVFMPQPVSSLMNVSDLVSVASTAEYLRRRASWQKRLLENDTLAIILSSKLACDIPVWNVHLVPDYSKRVVMDSLELNNCVEELYSSNTKTALVRCPTTVDAYPRGLTSWVEAILEMTHDHTSKFMILSDNMDHLVAFLSIAMLIRDTGSMYSAMVLGARCGLDRHLHPTMVEALHRL